MPILGTVSSSYNVPEQLLYYAGIYNNFTYFFLYGIGLDSSNLPYLVGTSYDAATTTQGVVAKFTNQLSNTWQKSLEPASGNGNFNSVSIDSSGNVYVVGYVDAGLAVATFAKYNSSGTLQWQRKISSSGQTDFSPGVLDSSGNLYAGGRMNFGGSVAGGSDLMCTVKYNSSGAIQWQRYIGPDSSSFAKTEAIVFDSANSMVYSIGTGMSYEGIIAKYNTSGTLQWRRRLKKTGGNGIYWGSGTLDSGGNVYAGGYDLDNSDGYIAKYDSSGTIQWQRKIATASALKITSDSSDNLYVWSNSLKTLFKYNTSGSLTMQKTFTQSGLQSWSINEIKVDSTNGILYMAGYWRYNSIYTGFAFQYPTSMPNKTLTLPAQGGSSTITVASGSYTDAAGVATADSYTTAFTGTATGTEAVNNLSDIAGGQTMISGTL